jgi:hypothetical protein
MEYNATHLKNLSYIIMYIWLCYYHTVYNKKNGQIIHIHEFTALEGDSLPDEKEMIDYSINSACSITGRHISELAGLKASKEQIVEGFEYKVDLKRHVLITKRKKLNRIKLKAKYNHKPTTVR